MKTNLRVCEASHIEKVARRKLVTLVSMKNGGCDRSVKQQIDRRTEGSLLGRLGDVGPLSVGPNLHKFILLQRRNDKARGVQKTA